MNGKENQKLRVQHDERNVIVEIGIALGAASQAATSGGSQIIEAISEGLIGESIKWGITLLLLGAFIYLNRAYILKHFNKQQSSAPNKPQPKNRLRSKSHQTIEVNKNPKTYVTKTSNKSTKTDMNRDHHVFTWFPEKKRRKRSKTLKKHEHVLATSSQTTDQSTIRYEIKLSKKTLAITEMSKLWTSLAVFWIIITTTLMTFYMVDIIPHHGTNRKTATKSHERKILIQQLKPLCGR